MDDYTQSITDAKEKIEADGWVFFVDSFRRGVYKARPDGSEFMKIPELSVAYFSSNYRNLQFKDDFITYDFEQEYSISDEDHQEFNRYRDTVTASIMPSQQQATQVKRLEGYLGTSD